MFEGKTVGLIGAGVMAEVLIAGLLRKNVLTPEEIVVSHYRPERLEELIRVAPLRTTSSNAEAYTSSDVTIICVQPFAVRPVLQDLRPVVDPSHLLISIAAGLPTRFYQAQLGQTLPFLRAMPTFYGGAGIGTTALTLTPPVTADQLALATELFGAISEHVIVMPEQEIDAFTTF